MSTANTPTTFVCCVESGGLETQTVRMIESLRRWGGQFSQAPFYAVTPRFSPPLSHTTLAAFERLSVEYLRFHSNSRYAWKGFLNKPYALAAVEERATTEAIGWLDSDLLILEEPDQLALQPGEDILACASECKGIGTTGPDDPLDSYWGEICKIVGIELDALPWITVEPEGQRIRLYWNSGVFVYRKSTGFATPLLEATLRVFDARLVAQGTNDYLRRRNLTQHILGMAALKHGMAWRSLPLSHHYNLSSATYDSWQQMELLQSARILHYHDAMWPSYWEDLMKCLTATHPSVAEWLAPMGPLKNLASPHWRVVGKLLQHVRTRQELQYLNSCLAV